MLVDNAGSSVALDAADRDVVETLERQPEVNGHRQNSRQRAQQETLEAADSLTGFVPALASMEGLSTPPYLLYKMIGFDALHVRWSACLFVSGAAQGAELPVLRSLRAIRLTTCAVVLFLLFPG